ncbi:MAG: MFS transporter [Chloroflexi bacterium]|nr:MFS transporter [Chloroflexota bacterium]
MFALLRQRNFGLLWFGGLISMIGDWMLRIALPAYVYDLTGSTLATGLMFMVSTLPSIVLGSVAGVFVDRWDRQRTMVIINLILAATLLPLLLVRSTEWLWLVYVVAFAESLVGQFFGPAENALLPNLVGEEHLMGANSLNALNNNLARLIGPALGGVIGLTLGLSGVVVVDVVTYLAAAVLIALIRQPQKERVAAAVPSSVLTSSFTKVWREWLAGLSLIHQNRPVFLLFILFMMTSVGEGIMVTLFIPFVTEVLRGQALEIGWLMSAQAVGGILGGLVIARMGTRLKPHHLIGPSGILFGLIDLAIFNYPALIPGFTLALVLFVLVGLPGAAYSASISTLLQNQVQDEYRGRVFGALSTTMSLLVLVGMGFASVAGDRLGIVPVINVQGFGYVLAGTVAWLILRPHIASLVPTVLLPSEEQV